MKNTTSVSGSPDQKPTTAPVSAPVQSGNHVEPEFIRVPTGNRPCPHTGLKRSTLYVLIGNRQVRSVCLRQPGKGRGVRLIHLASLKDYIRREFERQNKEGQTEEAAD